MYSLYIQYLLFVDGVELRVLQVRDVTQHLTRSHSLLPVNKYFGINMKLLAKVRKVLATTAHSSYSQAIQDSWLACPSFHLLAKVNATKLQKQWATLFGIVHKT